MDLKKNIYDAYLKINEESNRLINWSLSILGGSILIVFNKADFVQLSGCWKVSYALCGLGWILLLLSCYFGQLLTRNIIAGSFFREKNSFFKNLNTIINRRFRWQINSFIVGLLTFVFWFCILLMSKILSEDI